MTSLLPNLQPLDRSKFRPILKELEKMKLAVGPNPFKNAMKSLTCSFDDLRPTQINHCHPSFPQRHSCGIQHFQKHGTIYCDYVNLSVLMRELHHRIPDQPEVFQSNFFDEPYLRDPDKGDFRDHELGLLLCLNFLKAAFRIIVQRHQGKGFIRKVDFLQNLGTSLTHRSWLQVVFGWNDDSDNEDGKQQQAPTSAMGATGQSTALKDHVCDMQNRLYFSVCDHFFWEC